MATRTETPKLPWSEHGQIGCDRPGHAPYRGTDTWVWGRWKQITPREAAEFERELEHPPRCETCPTTARSASAGDARP